MAKKNEPGLTGQLLTTIARTVGVTAGMIVNKTAELTEVAVQAAGSTMNAAPKKKSAPKKRKAAVKKSPAKKKSTSKKRGPKKKST